MKNQYFGDIFSIPHVFFMLAQWRSHVGCLERIMKNVKDRWEGQIKIWDPIYQAFGRS